MGVVKAEAIRLIQSLPDDCSLEDIQYHLFVQQKVARGLAAVEDGRCMTQDQAELWGGAAGQPFDPNYHQKTDTVDNIDRKALGINGKAAAHAVALYAQDLSGDNGVPVRQDRTRSTIEQS